VTAKILSDSDQLSVDPIQTFQSTFSTTRVKWNNALPTKRILKIVTDLRRILQSKMMEKTRHCFVAQFCTKSGILERARKSTT